MGLIPSDAEASMYRHAPEYSSSRTRDR